MRAPPRFAPDGVAFLAAGRFPLAGFGAGFFAAGRAAAFFTPVGFDATAFGAGFPAFVAVPAGLPADGVGRRLLFGVGAAGGGGWVRADAGTSIDGP